MIKRWEKICEETELERKKKELGMEDKAGKKTEPGGQKRVKRGERDC